jgi:glutathione S-transferase
MIDYDRSVVLYTCPAGTHGANVPLIAHPCGVAAQALDRAGHDYTVETVAGFKNIPLSRRGKREKIIALTGQQDVPVLLLDDDSTVQGSGAIVAWAEGHSAAA